jgi:hypothetical protein
VMVQLHSFLTFALDRGERSGSHSHNFAPREVPLVPSEEEVGGPHSQSGCFGEEKNLLPLLTNNSLYNQPTS